MRIIVGLLLCAFSVITMAEEVVYVDDTLRVGVRSEPTGGGATLAVVTTGTRLEVLERRGSYIHVRTPNGVEGWARGAYMSANKPATILLKEANITISQLREQLKDARPGATAKDDELIAKLQARISQLGEENSALQEALDASPSSGDALAESSDTLRTVTALSLDAAYLLGISVFFLALGFLFGVSWHKSQVSKRLGGFTL